MPSHSLLLLCCNLIGAVKIEDANVLEIDFSTSPCDPNENLKTKLPLLRKPIPLNAIFKNDYVHNLLCPHRVLPRHA